MYFLLINGVVLIFQINELVCSALACDHEAVIKIAKDRKFGWSSFIHYFT